MLYDFIIYFSPKSKKMISIAKYNSSDVVNYASIIHVQKLIIRKVRLQIQIPQSGILAWEV